MRDGNHRDDLPPRLRVLLVEEDPEFAEGLQKLLARRVVLRIVSDAEAALAVFPDHDLLLLGVGDLDASGGLDLLEQVRIRDGRFPVCILAASARPESALRAGRLGALHILPKEMPLPELAERIREACQAYASSVRSLPVADDRRDALRWRFVGDSQVVRQLLADAAEVARSDSPVLITGEHGTGKEVLARHIHLVGPRRRQAFVPVNCAAVPETLFESELFGHERGAFTDAVRTRRGSFEQASGGTLLLDEITEMPRPLQPKMLRALQDHEYYRVGGEAPRKSDVRVICTTNRDPRAAISKGSLREDLYYRISVVTFEIPPLRDRREDVPALARYFLSLKSAELGKLVERISPAAESLLLSYHWPGNVRELANVIERAVVFCRTDEIGPELLTSITEGGVYLALPWEAARDQAMRRFELGYLSALLRVNRGSVSKCAKAMRISRQALYKLLSRAGLDPASFRPPRKRSRSAPGARPSTEG